MSVNPDISHMVILHEIDECKEDAIRFGWEFSPIDLKDLSFTVTMTSSIDNERYILYIRFDDYKELPLYLDFIHHHTGEIGIKNAYPAPNKGPYEGFFHDKPCICSPCSRKAYSSLGGPHKDWILSGWMENKNVGSLTNLQAILRAICFRINNPELYGGRMNG